MVRVVVKSRYRSCIAVDERSTYICVVCCRDSVQITGLYRWGSPEITSRVEIDAPRQYLKPYLDTIAVEVDSKELLAIEASNGRSSLNVLKMCTNKPLVLVDKDPWYRWALERLGLEYRYEGQG
jgi:hypothetical protein